MSEQKVSRTVVLQRSSGHLVDKVAFKRNSQPKLMRSSVSSHPKSLKAVDSVEFEKVNFDLNLN